MQVIDTIVTFVVIFIVFFLVRFIFFSIDTDLSVDKLPPGAITGTVWRSMLGIGLQLFSWIVAGITFLWIVWLILKVTPIFGPLIIATIPPFRQFARAGIFSLWSDLFVSIIDLDFKGVAVAFIKFGNRSGKYMVQNTVGLMLKDKNKKSTPKEIEPRKTTSAKEEDSTETDEPEGVDATQESTFTAEQHQAVEDKLQMCISEKLLPEYDSMSFIERLKIQSSNNIATVTCKAESVADFMKMKSTT